MKLFVAMPVYRCPVKAVKFDGLPTRVSIALTHLEHAYPDTLFGRVNNMTVDRARAELVGMFLGTDSTHLLFWDDDIAFSFSAILELLESCANGPGIAHLPYLRRNGGGFALEGVMSESRAARVGMGATMIRRDLVVETVRRCLSFKSLLFPGYLCTSAFIPMVAPNGDLYGEDYAFIHRARVPYVGLVSGKRVWHAGRTAAWPNEEVLEV